ncbi:hypothetical protein ES705_20481 [subsurface metagenome]
MARVENERPGPASGPTITIMSSSVAVAIKVDGDDYRDGIDHHHSPREVSVAGLVNGFSSAKGTDRLRF